MLNVTYYLTRVYFLTMSLKVLNTSRPDRGGYSLRVPILHDRGSLIALWGTAPILLYFYSPNGNNEGRNQKGASARLGSP